MLHLLRVGWPAVALAVSLSTQATAFAQDVSGPFRELRISVGPAENVNRGAVHEFWRPTTGLSARIETPFEIGYVAAGARLAPFVSRGQGRPDFNALLVYAGWGLAWQPAGAVRLSGGIRIGNLNMRFDERSDPFSRSESELTVGGTGRIELYPLERVGVYAEGSWSRTFTSVRMDLMFGTVGLVVRLRSPDWLQRVLQ